VATVAPAKIEAFESPVGLREINKLRLAEDMAKTVKAFAEAGFGSLTFRSKVNR
jgi:hypothetical protein